MSEALLACRRCRYYYWVASAPYPPIRAEHCYPAALLLFDSPATSHTWEAPRLCAPPHSGFGFIAAPERQRL
jgi:hypothetical protein